MAMEKRLLGNIKDIVYYYQLQPKEKVIYVSAAVNKTIGVTEEEIYENPRIILDRIHPEDRWLLSRRISREADFDLPLTLRVKNNLGEYIWLEDYSSAEYDEDGKVTAIMGSLRDITMRKKSQEEMRYKINHDAITGVYNRHYFETKFRDLNETKDTSVGIIMCDIDDLKLINDAKGHFVGDNFIVAAGAVLLQMSSENLMAFRIGGDEFCLLAIETSQEEVTNIKNYLRNLLEVHNSYDKDTIVEMSIGCAFSETSIGRMHHIFKIADKAMYKDKQSKKIYQHRNAST